MAKYYDPFLYEYETKVINIVRENELDRTNETFLVELDDTIFYPGGGGQPCDTGYLTNNNFLGNVTEVFKRDDKIFHRVKVINGVLNIEDRVKCKVDSERRLKLVQMHSGEHILMASLLRILNNISIEKISLCEDESSLFVNCSSLNWIDLFNAEEIANRIIYEGHDIVIKELTVDEARTIPNLRINFSKIKGNKIRIVEIKDFDIAACTGIHLPNTKMVGNILITKYNIVKGKYEIRFKTNVREELYEYARIARLSASIIGKDYHELPNVIELVIKEKEDIKKKFREMSSKLASNFNKEKIRDINFIYAIFEDIEKKKLVDKIAEKLEENTIACIVNKLENNAMIIIMTSKEGKINAVNILNKILDKYGGKGGGKDNYAMGSIKKEHSEDIINFVRNIINEDIC